MASLGPKGGQKRKRDRDTLELEFQKEGFIAKAHKYSAFGLTFITGTPFYFRGETTLHEVIDSDPTNDFVTMMLSKHFMDEARAWWNKTNPEDERKLRVKSFIDLRDQDGDSFLHLAALKGDASLVANLIAAGAKQNCLNNKNQTPAQVALANGHKELAVTLGAAMGLSMAASAVSAVSNFLGISSSSTSLMDLSLPKASSLPSAPSEEEIGPEDESEAVESSTKKQRLK